MESRSAGRLADAGDRGGPERVWDADAGARQHVLHQSLVAERDGLLDGRTGHAHGLAQTSRQHHGWLPEGLDQVDVSSPQRVQHRADHCVLIAPRPDLDVLGQRPASGLGQLIGVLIADPDHARTHLRQAPREQRHLPRIARAEEQHVTQRTSPTLQPDLANDLGEGALDRGRLVCADYDEAVALVRAGWWVAGRG